MPGAADGTSEPGGEEIHVRQRIAFQFLRRTALSISGACASGIRGHCGPPGGRHTVRGGGQPVCPCQNTSKPGILTAAYDNQRDGYNPNESTLTASAISTKSLVVANTFPVDTNDLPQYLNGLNVNAGASNPVVAEPLYISDITAPGNSNCDPCDMVIAATLNGTVFAWIADGPNVGTLLWSRQGSGQTQGQNSLPVDDCGNGMAQGTIGPVDWGQSNSLPFAGVVSTPVIDLSPSGSTTPSAVPVMFVTSWCQDNSIPTPVRQWWLHELNLTTGADYVTPYNIIGKTSSGVLQIYANGWLNADDIDSNGHIPFKAKYQMQRPALLEVKNPNGGSPNHLIYMGFGTGTYEKSAGQKGYHGWVLAFTTDQNGNISPVSTTKGPNAFATTPLGCGPIPSSGGANCDGFYNPSSYGSPACNCLRPTGYQTTVNYGGHGAGIWSSRALAATAWNALGDNAAHIFADTGNGGFQNQVAASGQEPNFGDSLVDFIWAGGTPTSMQPAQSITAYGGPLVCSGTGNYCDMTSFEFPNATSAAARAGPVVPPLTRRATRRCSR
jgi:hypothetical protein